MKVEILKVDTDSPDGQDIINKRIQELEKEGSKVDVDFKHVDKRFTQFLLKIERKEKPNRMIG